MMKEIQIATEIITLGQFLKLAEVIQSGGMAKWFLQEYEVIVNGERETRRGRKLGNQDVVEVDGFGNYVVVYQ